MLSFNTQKQKLVQIGIKLHQIQHHRRTLRILGAGSDRHIIVGIRFRAHQMILRNVISHTLYAFRLFRLLHISEYGGVPRDGSSLQVSKGIVVRYRIGQSASAPGACVSQCLHIITEITEIIQLTNQLDVFLRRNSTIILVIQDYVAAADCREGVILLTVYIPELAVVSGSRHCVNSALRRFLLCNSQAEVHIILPAGQLGNSILVSQILTDGDDLAHRRSHIGRNCDRLAGNRGLIPALLRLIFARQRHISGDEIIGQFIEGALSRFSIHITPGCGKDQVYLFTACENQGIHGLVIAPAHDGHVQRGIERLQILIRQFQHSVPVIRRISDQIHIHRIRLTQINI